MISNELIDGIKSINNLIALLDKDKDRSNNYAFTAMREHIEEIEGLFKKRDKHWAAETVDFLIHCLLLLDRNGYSKEKINEILSLRCGKFEQKISHQIE